MKLLEVFVSVCNGEVYSHSVLHSSYEETQYSVTTYSESSSGREVLKSDLHRTIVTQQKNSSNLTATLTALGEFTPDGVSTIVRECRQAVADQIKLQVEYLECITTKLLGT